MNGANSVDNVQMLHFVGSDLGLHCVLSLRILMINTVLKVVFTVSSLHVRTAMLVQTVQTQIV